ncbi:MAG: DUF3006 domain-containing protein [Gemmatimonadaceae bacterium]|nr:DUF3006 domain-containing protein [Gemmatimonadaceae bacterium]
MADQSYVWRIDGIEDDVARVEEDGTRMISLPRHLLPANAREGQVVRVTAAASGKGSLTLTLAIDDEATAAEADRSRAQTAAIAARSKKRDPGGNVSL